MGLRQYEYQMFSNGDLSQATLTSTAVADCTNMLGFSIQNVTTGNAVGTISVQGSNDPEPNTSFTNRIVNWTTIVTTPVTAPGNVLINVTDCFYRWVRLTYTRTSGTGTLNAILMGKGV